MGLLEPPRTLEKRDVRTSFDSGAPELDTWLKDYAYQNQRANNAVTYVSVIDGEVVGYYCIATAGVGRDRVPDHLAKSRPTDIPCILLARLAVDRRMQGRRVGLALLRDAVERSIQLTTVVGAVCLLIHCRDDAARDFYLHQAEFLQSPVDPMHLLLPLKQAASWLS
jgi:GNAT superfamily N-acetyltransferase